MRAVEQDVTAPIRILDRFRKGERLVAELRGSRMFAAARENERLDAPPVHLRDNVVCARCFATDLGKLPRLVIAMLLPAEPREIAGERRHPPTLPHVAQRLKALLAETSFPELFGPLTVADTRLIVGRAA